MKIVNIFTRYFSCFGDFLRKNMLRLGPLPFFPSGCWFGSDGGFMVINLPVCSQCQSREKDAVLQLTDLRIGKIITFIRKESVAVRAHNLVVKTC